MIELSLTNIIAIIVAIFGGLAALIKIIAVLFERGIRADFKALNERLVGMDKAFKEDAQQWIRLEREMLQMKAELPNQYVRREDYIRGQSVLEAKIDGLGTKLENVQLRAAAAKT